MALQNAPGEQVDKRFEEIVEKALGVLEHAGGLASGATARHRQEYGDVPGQHDAALLQRLPQRFPARIIELRLDLRDHQIDLAHTALGDQPLQFGERRLRSFRQHRHADQAVRRRLAEVEEPVVVDLVASDAQHRIVGRDLKDRAEDDLRLDPVAIHVFKAQFGDRRPALALIVDAAAIEGVVERLDRARVAVGGGFCRPSCPTPCRRRPTPPDRRAPRYAAPGRATRPAAASATNPPAIAPDPYDRRTRSADPPFLSSSPRPHPEFYHIL